MGAGIIFRAATRMTFRSVALFVAMFAASSTPSAADNAPKLKIVVELFTSQGCSYCPPADALLGELAKRDDVIALTFNVNYWDYLGWTDSLALPGNKHRQAGYVKHLGNIDAFTPQMIIAGAISVVGSRKHEVDAALKKAATRRAAARVALKKDGSDLVIDITPAGGGLMADEKCRVVLVAYDKKHVVKIGAGENVGKRIAYHNVVRDVAVLGDWAGKPRKLRVKINPKRGGYALLLQGPKSGKIFAAADIEF